MSTISYELFTAVVIFLSKYLFRANEKINKENTDINNEGINVNRAKNITYFLFAIDPLTFRFSLSEFFISIKIIIKKEIINIIFNTNNV